MSNHENKGELENGLFLTSLETFLFARRLQQHQKTTNIVDKGLATMLLELSETIADFLESAKVDDENGDQKISDIIPSVENSILQAHRMYYCAPCNKNVKGGTDLHDHFLGNSHLKHLKNYAKGLNQSSATSLVAKSSVQSIGEQRAAKPEKKRINSLPALLREVGVKENLPKRVRDIFIGKEITEFTNKLARDGNALKSKGHNRICKMLQNQLSNRYPQVKVYTFGSVVCGLGHAGSDLDLFIDTENCFYQRLPKRRMKDTIYQVQRILFNFPHQWQDLEPVVHARTPILRAYCSAENIECDLSFSNGLSTCNTTLITYFIGIQPISKNIILFLKFWVGQLQLGVNSYLLTLMVVFYLQQEKLLPSVKQLQEATEVILIDGWNANFATPSLAQLQLPLASDFRKYLIGFFKFYGYDFDYTNYIICPLTGTRVPKHLFDHGKEHQLPPVFKEFAQYMSKIDLDRADEVEDLFSNYKPIVIQDPMEQIHNVAKGIQEQKLCKIISYFRSTHELLLNSKF